MGPGVDNCSLGALRGSSNIKRAAFHRDVGSNPTIRGPLPFFIKKLRIQVVLNSFKLLFADVFGLSVFVVCTRVSWDIRVGIRTGN